MSSLRDHYVDVLYSAKELIKAIENNTEMTSIESPLGGLTKEINIIRIDDIKKELQELKQEI